MSIPDFQSLMLPILRRLAERQWSPSDLVEAMAAEHSLTDEERRALLPSGRQTMIANRTHWALAHLGKANVIARVSRGQYEAMERGRGILADPPDRITLAYLNQFPEFVAFRTAVRAAGAPTRGRALLHRPNFSPRRGAPRKSGSRPPTGTCGPSWPRRCSQGCGAYRLPPSSS